MLRKHLTVHRLIENGVVAVIRAENSEQAIRIAEACVEGGIHSLEFTFTIPYAHQVIENTARHFAGTDVVVGAGTVLDAETARVAILSGAAFVVSPAVSADVLRLCNRYAVPCMPGAMSIRDVIEAMEGGADIVKLFPGEAFGPSMIRSIKGPLPQANVMPTGGVDASNIEEWLKAGASAVGVGGSLIAPAKTGDYAAITAKSKQLVEKVQAFRSASRT